MTNLMKTAMLLKLQGIFRDHFLDDSITLAALSSPEEIEAWDSLAHISLLTVVERAFGVRFSAIEMGEIVDVGTLMEALKRKGASH